MEPGATLQGMLRLLGQFLNGDVQLCQQRASQLAKQKPLPAASHCHRLLFCIASRFPLIVISIYEFLTIPNLPSSPRLRVFRPVPFLAQPSRHLHRTHTRFQRHQTNPFTLPDRREEVPLATNKTHTITSREQPQETNSHIGE